MQLDELGFIHGQLEIEDIVPRGGEGDAPCLRSVQVGIDRHHQLFIDG